MTPHPATRRRGSALTEAIYLATLEELARTSFAELSFDKIATAAGTGKAALYRRWSSPDELVLAALTDPATGFGQPPVPPGTGSLRADLITLLTHFAHVLDEPRGRALRPLIAYRHQHPELFDRVWASVVLPAREVLLAVMGEAVDRGEADPARVSERSAEVGPRMLLVDAWSTDSVGVDEVVAVVDEVLVPLLSARPTPATWRADIVHKADAGPR
ncbi:TetR-like C-terminal domain-containing protein [Umezawaea endophytica]|uniref:TetR/AcrR family transcriptional regulator C-terminal ligand-binding domain-containing protein n=1 Tax=Umezawaea endophytica TaxID=1654476 RepID=A0A9X2VHR8_9PSEU|nr:TetR-like C-terminal domain-containing protein [Umezawaea endophytica]MCS7476712.1 TetR/AcrR family transcriptional regulator C-terminal ligand-binding domain-containing protein [Umezawaea endophytica]